MTGHHRSTVPAVLKPYYGTMGDDTIFSKDGADELWGGAGADTYIYKQIYQSDPGGDGQQNDTILDFDYRRTRLTSVP